MKAPGTAKSTTLPFMRSEVEVASIPSAVATLTLASGIRSPTWMAICTSPLGVVAPGSSARLARRAESEKPEPRRPTRGRPGAPSGHRLPRRAPRRKPARGRRRRRARAKAVAVRRGGRAHRGWRRRCSRRLGRGTGRAPSRGACPRGGSRCDRHRSACPCARRRGGVSRPCASTRKPLAPPSSISSSTAERRFVAPVVHHWHPARSHPAPPRFRTPVAPFPSPRHAQYGRIVDVPRPSPPSISSRSRRTASPISRATAAGPAARSSSGAREVCSKCGARGELSAERLSNEGQLYVFSIVHRSFPGIEVPYISAIVDLEGGGTVKGNLINIEPDPEKGEDRDAGAGGVSRRARAQRPRWQPLPQLFL